MSQTADPADSLAAITPSDTAFVSCRALYVGSAGNLTLQAQRDTAPVTLVGVPAGTVLPIRCARVMATGTTAGNIVALF